MSAALVLRDISKRFGDFWVLREVRASVPSGKITAFIGPNGAGKTTIFHVICGACRPDHGSVILKGEDVTGMRPSSIADRGVGRQFQDIRVFHGLTALENIALATFTGRDCDVWQAWRGSPRDDRDNASRWLEYVGLQDYGGRFARELSFGQQKLLSLARLFARGSDVLLLDEPTAGLSHAMVDRVCILIQRVASEQGITVVMVEHNMGVVADLASWIHFVHEGHVAFSGETAHVLGDASVREIYMGL